MENYNPKCPTQAIVLCREKSSKRHPCMLAAPAIAVGQLREISRFRSQFVSLSEFDSLTHTSMTLMNPTCHCDRGGSNSERLKNLDPNYEISRQLQLAVRSVCHEIAKHIDIGSRRICNLPYLFFFF